MPPPYLAKVRLCNLLHFKENHGGDLLRVEGFGLALVLHLDFRTRVIVNDCEGPVLHIGLNHIIFKVPANESLGI